MRNLIVCCDGTWNTPDQKHDGVPTPTNVVRLFNSVAGKDGKGRPQVKYYHPGVGTEGNWWDKIAGGAAGVGLSKNVMSAYKWLAVHYQPGDRIFMFGFSRGAYTVRAAAGMMGRCGLLMLADLSDDEVWKRVDKAYKQGYRGRQPRKKWAGKWEFHGTGSPKSVGIHFLGVWDTVGALGIPNDMAILNLLDNTKAYAFFDTTLGDGVVNARHAVALDEMRASFAPTLWDVKAGRKGLKQIWFPGVHSDVGGGYPETGLSDGALEWMMDEARACGLAFHKGMSGQVKPDSLGTLHDSRSGLFELMRSLPRSVPLIAKSNTGKLLHRSVMERHDNPPITQGPYRPTRVLDTGESVEIPIFAAQPWNETGLYLEAGAKYRFEASGQWLDRSIPCSPEGPEKGDFRVGEIVHLAGKAWGKLEKMWKKLTKNEEADFRGSRRLEDYEWFYLVGSIANGGPPPNSGKSTTGTHEQFGIGKEHEKQIKNPGYLYCFANDAWGFYGNNRGSVTLRVERIA